jgi:hypothetical protein
MWADRQRTDWQTDIPKLIITLHNSVNTPKKYKYRMLSNGIMPILKFNKNLPCDSESEARRGM